MYASRGGRPRGWWMPKTIKGYMAIKRGPKLLTLAQAMKKYGRLGGMTYAHKFGRTKKYGKKNYGLPK